MGRVWEQGKGRSPSRLSLHENSDLLPSTISAFGWELKTFRQKASTDQLNERQGASRRWKPATKNRRLAPCRSHKPNSKPRLSSNTYGQALKNFRLTAVLQTAILLSLCLFIGCNKTAKQNKAQTETKTAYQVIAASYALQFLTEQIAGEAIEVKFLVDDSQDPKTWRPTVEQVKEIQKSDLVVVNGTGATYAEWLKRVSLLESKICFSAETFPTAEYIFVADYQVVHSHGPEGEHSHDYSVPYCWLDPANASQQASEICESLKRTYPDKAEEFDERLAALQTKLKSLSDEFDAAKEQNNSRQVLSVNPRMKYLTRAAGLDDVHLFAFDADSDLTSSKEKLKSLTASEDFSPACVLVENSSTSSIEDLLPDQAASDWPQTEVNLLDHRPKEGDYFSAMQSNLKALELPN